MLGDVFNEKASLRMCHLSKALKEAVSLARMGKGIPGTGNHHAETNDLPAKGVWCV